MLAWCSQFGLLGILHHRLIAAYFWPTWEPSSIGSNPPRPHQLVLTEPEALDRFPKRIYVDHAAVTPARNPRARTPLSEQDFLGLRASNRTTGIRESHVLVRDVSSFDQVEVDIVEGYGQFFPHVRGIPAWTEQAASLHKSLPWGVPEGPPPDETDRRSRDALNRARYPTPESSVFQERYAEPRYLFNRVVHGFCAGVQFLVDQAENERAIRTAVNMHGHHVPAQFVMALRQASPSVGWNGERWAPTWEIRSLLSAMSVMVIQDLAVKRGRIPTCENCGRRFFTDRSDAKHCKRDCGNALRVRRHRAKMKRPNTETSAQ